MCWSCLGSLEYKSSCLGLPMIGHSYCCSDEPSLVAHYGPDKAGMTSSVFGRRRSCSLFAMGGVESFA